MGLSLSSKLGERINIYCKDYENKKVVLWIHEFSERDEKNFPTANIIIDYGNIIDKVKLKQGLHYSIAPDLSIEITNRLGRNLSLGNMFLRFSGRKEEYRIIRAEVDDHGRDTQANQLIRNQRMVG